MASPFSAPPKLLGIVFSDVDDTAKHKVGTVALSDTGARYRYVSAAEALAAGDAVDFTSAFAASVTDNGDVAFGVAPVAIGSGKYGWILESGVVSAAVTASMSLGTVLGSKTSTGGDLNAVATSNDGVRGVALTAESGGKATVFLL